MSTLVQREHIMQLMDLVLEEGQQEIVQRMFNHLNQDQSDLLILLHAHQQRSEHSTLHLIHRVKNHFGNFGAFQACRLLDKLYQDLRNSSQSNTPEIQSTIAELTEVLPQTMTVIRRELESCWS